MVSEKIRKKIYCVAFRSCYAFPPKKSEYAIELDVIYFLFSGLWFTAIVLAAFKSRNVSVFGLASRVSYRKQMNDVSR